MNYTLIHKRVTVSTNLDARTLPPGTVVIAREQTAGRGRLDHRWTGAPGENLMFSLVLDLADLPPAAAATLPLVAGLAVAEAMGEGFGLKWPNDVYYGGRKLCGILCERVGDRAIVGIGLNVNETDFPPELVARATSLRLVTGRAHDLDTVLAAILAAFDRLLPRWRAGGFTVLHAAYAARDLLRGRTLAVRQTDDDDAPVRGVCGGVQPDGTLRVGDTVIYAGEAHIL